MADINAVLRGASPKKEMVMAPTAQNPWTSALHKIETGAEKVYKQEQAKEAKEADMKWLYIAGAAVVAWYFLSQ